MFKAGMMKFENLTFKRRLEVMRSQIKIAPYLMNYILLGDTEEKREFMKRYHLMAKGKLPYNPQELIAGKEKIDARRWETPRGAFK